MWLDDPVTKELRAWASERREEVKENWEFDREDTEFKTAVRDAFSKGVLSVLRELETPTPETILGVSFERTSEAGRDSGEHERP